MKTRIFLFAASLCCFFLTQSLDAQVTSVNYQVKYDTSECRYDAYIIINSGSATTVGQRTQASAQFSLVIPTGRTISIVESHNPLSALDNVTPINWGITTTVDAPTVDPGNKYVSITVPLSPTSRYNAADVQSGDTVKIFSFVVSDNLQCGEGMKMVLILTHQNQAWEEVISAMDLPWEALISYIMQIPLRSIRQNLLL